MLQLFEEYKNAGKLSEALLAGRNAFNRSPGDVEVFDAYYSYLCMLAGSLPALTDKVKFADQAEVALAFFSENAELTAALVEHISGCRARLDGIYREIDRLQREKAQAHQLETTQKNSDCLKRLFALKDRLQKAASQEELDAVLAEIAAADAALIKDAFSKEQSGIYDSLTRDHTELISARMRELEYKRNAAYNKKAAEAFERAFKEFRSDENRYKKQTQLFALAASTLFAFDAARLFNETLIYYNHVYSYIFSKLDDDGKFALTRYSIECERELG